MKKISIIGPESSGKTTLANSLSKLLKESFVIEEKKLNTTYILKEKKELIILYMNMNIKTLET